MAPCTRRCSGRVAATDAIERKTGDRGAMAAQVVCGLTSVLAGRPAEDRRALVNRDRGCGFPGCAARICDAHHLRSSPPERRSWINPVLFEATVCRLDGRDVHQMSRKQGPVRALDHAGAWLLEHSPHVLRRAERCQARAIRGDHRLREVVVGIRREQRAVQRARCSSSRKLRARSACGVWLRPGANGGANDGTMRGSTGSPPAPGRTGSGRSDR